MSDVSVIIPTWNRAATIEQAVRSALTQTLPPREVLVCDDGSSDETETVVAAIGDPRVRWLPGPRGGRPAIPRNRGIRASRGNWLAFLDSDDEWLPEKLEQQFALLKYIDCKAACTNAHRFIPHIGVVGLSSAWPQKRKSLDDFLRINRVVCSSALVHRSLFDLAGMFPEEPALKAIEDYAFWLRVATYTDFAYLHAPLVMYKDDLSDSVRANALRNEIKQRHLVYASYHAWLREKQGTSGIDARLIARIERRCRMIILWMHFEKWAVRAKATISQVVSRTGRE